jgi:hypothetical protein
MGRIGPLRDGPAAAPPQPDAQVAERVAAGMSDWVGGWVRYGSTLQGPPEENALVAPYSRSGGWGYISFVRFHLEDDEAIVLSMDDAASEYASCQITDIWGI